MLPRSALAVLLSTVFFVRIVVAQDSPNNPSLQAVPFNQVKIHDRFWSPKLEVNRKATIVANLRQCEETHRIRNFAVAAGLDSGKHVGALYNDSDVYKVLEGAAYSLQLDRDAALEAKVDRIIDLIAAAQQKDGYLNTYYTLVKPQERWKNIAHGHEMYCAGHLIEAAVAYYQATGKRKLLDVGIRLADHIGTVFGPGKRPEPCGHQEIELALVKLWRITNDRKYLDLAKFFLDTRGDATTGRKMFGDYAQDHIPVRKQREVVGHAVRAMYLYCAMADLAAATGDKELMDALIAIWHDVVDRKMYITGGIGPSAKNEGFTVPYDLPNDTAYAETCAAIGMALWNHRMFLLTRDGKYADILEREVYNGLLSGVALTGDRFFYVNPLGSKGGHHRVPWFDCSCCPTNIVRYLPAMGERVYAAQGDNLWTVLYLGNTAEVKLASGTVKVVQETEYPWVGEIKFILTLERPFAFGLHLRIPGWCKQVPVVEINGKHASDLKASQGYVTLSRTWQPGDVVRLILPMAVKRNYADPRVKANVGRVALMRGPIVFCLEGVDNDGQVRNLVLPKVTKLEAIFDPSLLGGVITLSGEAKRVRLEAGSEKRLTEQVRFKAVPYALWDNRAAGQMVVWVPEQED